MCGIVGIFSRDQPIRAEALARATRSLQHRGPDDHNDWISSTRMVGLGHTRLSIVDLQSGAHPIHNEDGTIHIVVNGEFYGDETIRQDLLRRGHTFRTRSDSEIALHLYEEVGPRCLEHLRGEFAFIIWDERSDRLFAARDRFGIKPLFYAEVDGSLYFASEAKALFAAGVPAVWDDETIFRQLFFCLDEKRSLFRGIAQIPPGHYLIASRTSIRLAKYWDIFYPPKGRESRDIGNSETVAQTRYLLEEAVRLRLRGDVPSGFLLSGGLDSSSVLALAAPHARHPLTAFTIAFDGDGFDESAHAEKMARHVGAEFRPLHISERDFIDHFVDTVLQGESVLFNGHAPARYLLSRFIQQAGFKVVLSGEGADELFAGYGFCQAAMSTESLTSGWRRALLLPLRLLQPKSLQEVVIAQTSPWLFRIGRVLGAPPPLVNALGEGLEMIRAVIAPDFLRMFSGRDPYKEFLLSFDLRRRVLRREPVKQLLYLWMKSIFANYHLAADRLDMAHAIEVRLPFLDHVLFEFVSQFPARVLARGGRVKSLLREVARPFIPPSVYGRDKQAFLAPPLSVGEKGKILELVQDMLRSKPFAAAPFFDWPQVLSLLDRRPDGAPGRTIFDALILMIVSIAILHHHYHLQCET